jgi:putative ABC transport system ATP-binding protein
MAIVECRKLKKIYKVGDNEIIPLHEIDLDIEKGEIIAITGPSGSGKTTLLNLISGIDKVNGGEITVNGQKISELTEKLRDKWVGREVGYIFQTFNLVPVLTALRNVELPLFLENGMTSKQRKERARRMLAEVGLAERADHLPSQLSGGQEQRVAVARSLVREPNILVADEPTGELDAQSADDVLDLFERFNKEKGTTVVMVTHDHRATRRAGRILHLDKGDFTEVENQHIL